MNWDGGREVGRGERKRERERGGREAKSDNCACR